MKRQKYTEDDYVLKCEELDNVYAGSYKTKKATIIKYICKRHADVGVQECDWAHFRLYKNSCPYCSGRYRTTSDAQKMVLNNNIIFTSEYIGSEKPIDCFCKKCGHSWTCNRPIDLFKRDGGCPVCALESKSQKRRKTQEDFEADVMSVNRNIKIIGKYTGTHKLVRCRCEHDGYEWESYPANILNGSAGCPKCNNSTGENNIIEFMVKNGVRYSTQKTFDGCTDVRPLRFDVYDEDNNIAFEFQGEQHYFPIDFSGNGYEYASQQFDMLQRRDKIKREFCNQNGITLLCIPYWERDNVEQFILNNLKIYNKENIA